MEVAELVLWMDKAIDTREASYIPAETNTEIQKRKDGISIGRYGIDDSQALAATMPKGTKLFEMAIAGALIKWGNDITDWKKEVDGMYKDTLKPMATLNEVMTEERLKDWERWKDRVLSARRVVTWGEFPNIGKIAILLKWPNSPNSSVDYYPKDDKIHILKDSEWKEPGLRWLIDNLINT